MGGLMPYGLSVVVSLFCVLSLMGEPISEHVKEDKTPPAGGKYVKP